MLIEWKAPKDINYAVVGKRWKLDGTESAVPKVKVTEKEKQAMREHFPQNKYPNLWKYWE